MSMSYLDEFLKGKNINKTVAAAIKRLKGVDFTAIAVRGNSGLLIGAPLAAALDKNLIICRKKRDNSHSGRLVEGWSLGRQKILMLDDFSKTGNTIKQMYRNIYDYCCEPEVIGVYFYASTANSNNPEAWVVKKGVIIPMYRPRKKDKK